MPWQITRKDGSYCVTKEGESDPVPGGCHPTRAEALKHQRALYANESRMASAYDALDAKPVEVIEAPSRNGDQTELGLIRIAVPNDHAALTASVASAMESIVARLEAQEATQQALIAAVGELAALRPEVTVQPAEVTVAAALPASVSVEAPSVNVEAPVVEVSPAQVNVQPHIVIAAGRRRVTFERDRRGQIISATIEEEPT